MWAASVRLRGGAALRRAAMGRPSLLRHCTTLPAGTTLRVQAKGAGDGVGVVSGVTPQVVSGATTPTPSPAPLASTGETRLELESAQQAEAEAQQAEAEAEGRQAAEAKRAAAGGERAAAGGERAATGGEGSGYDGPHDVVRRWGDYDGPHDVVRGWGGYAGPHDVVRGWGGYDGPHDVVRGWGGYDGPHDWERAFSALRDSSSTSALRDSSTTFLDPLIESDSGNGVLTNYSAVLVEDVAVADFHKLFEECYKPAAPGCVRRSAQPLPTCTARSHREPPRACLPTPLPCIP